MYEHGLSNSRGVAILFKPTFNFKVDTIYNKDGRILILKVLLNEKELIIVNIYGPNEDNVDFYQHLFSKLEDEECSNMIIGGDYNLVLNLKIDKTGGTIKTNTKSSTYQKQMMENINLADRWRNQHPDKRQFTWRRQKPTAMQCRLDMFLVSDNMLGCVDQSVISPSLRSDHSLIGINCTFTEIQRGPGYWKLNCSLLTDANYINIIKSSHSEYNTIQENNDINLCLKWEMIKMEIRKQSIIYSSTKKKAKIKEQNQIETIINTLENKDNLSEEDATKIQENKDKLTELYNDKIRGAMLRSNALHYEQGDRPSKYFLNLEKSKQSKKSIHKLINNEGTELTNRSDILNEIGNYYKALYKRQNTMDTARPEIKEMFLGQNGVTKLTQELKNSCEGEITLDELQKALKTSKNNKSPGIDGIPYEFYKMFWPYICESLLKSLNYSYTHGQLSINQRRGIISLMPKGNKDVRYLSNCAVML